MCLLLTNGLCASEMLKRSQRADTRHRETLAPQREIPSLVTSAQANVPQSPIVHIPQFNPRICAVLPRGESDFHLLPNAERFQVRLAHGSLLKLERNFKFTLVPGAAIAVMHNTKLRLSHKLLNLPEFAVSFLSITLRASHLAALPRRTMKDLHGDKRRFAGAGRVDVVDSVANEACVSLPVSSIPPAWEVTSV